ncbi:MAG: acyltransferase [Cyanobacteriota bacterium]|nr:acyltransferase [Cyanobacteriota bacterium]
MSQPTQTSPPIDALLALRGVACFVIIIAHCNAPREFLVYGNYDLSWLFFAPGGVAVRIFFCLSGYLMGKVFYTQRYQTDFKGILRFWKKRALRVFPLYYFAILVLSLFVYPDILRPENWIYLWRLCTFTYHQVLPVGFNGALWSLSTEVQFYLFVPWIFIYLKRRLGDRTKILQFAVATSLGSLALRCGIWQAIKIQFPPPEDAIAFVKYVYVPMALNLDVFLCGLVLNFWINQTQKSTQNLIEKQQNTKLKQYRVVSIMVLIIMYLVTAYIKYYNKQILWQIAPTLSLLATCGFILAFESGNAYHNFKKMPLSWEWSFYLKHPIKILEVFGILSYGIYVWHLPIIARVQSIFTSEIPSHAYFQQVAIASILSTLLASVTYYYIERQKPVPNR